MSTLLATPQVSADSLSGRVYGHLLDGMLCGRITPGQLLNRRQVARELGVSLAPAAEAFVRLQAEGLLQPFGSRGTQVRLLRRQEVRDQFILRMALECQAARLYCGQALRAAGEDILALAARSDATPVNTPEDYRLEVELHLALAELSRCEALVTALRRVLRIGLFLAVEMLLPPARLGNPNHHVELVQNMMRATPDRAEALMRGELAETLKLLDSDIKQC